MHVEFSGSIIKSLKSEANFFRRTWSGNTEYNYIQGRILIFGQTPRAVQSEGPTLIMTAHLGLFGLACMVLSGQRRSTALAFLLLSQL